MPPLPDVPGVLRLRFHFTIGDDTHAACRKYYAYTGAAPSEADLVTWSSAILGYAGTALAPLYTADRVMTEVEATDLTTPTSATGIGVGTETGTRAGVELPAATSLLESLEVSRRYRGGHPRNYWPFGADTDLLTPQTWTADFVAACAAGLGDFESLYVGTPPTGITGLVPVSVSYYTGFTVFLGVTGRARNISKVRPVPVIDDVVGTIVRQGIAIIRRRELRLA